ncbi:Homologous-pairing protein 2 homolog [Eumeta japonica]|uniref:Homologous-pairing protein 2 homolog n=1 Tax=Eumeta variegata TaxID=151549 RepID=A0A4C1Y6T3_EUMVA|nr:Homologous-pairing protein 2 homolog [Eumeta japonica]
MANEAVLKYLMETNRPYSCTDVTANLRGAYTKTAVQKALDALSDSGKIKCKVYGKQKVYAAIQSENLDSENEIEDFDNKLKSCAEILVEKTATLKKAEAELKALLSAPTTSDAKKLISEINTKVETLQKKLDSLRTSTNVVSVDTKNNILDEHIQLCKEYRKRKRIATDIIESIMEGYPKPKKCLIEELGLETDEMLVSEIDTIPERHKISFYLDIVTTVQPGLVFDL